MSDRLSGRTAIVTGASRGIGAAVVRRFVAEGASVTIGHEPSKEMTTAASSLAAELQASSGRVVAIGADLADPLGPERLVEATNEAFGQIDILVANAAVSTRKRMSEISVAEWDYTHAVNVRATWLLVQSAYASLERSDHASVITVTSTMVESGLPTNASHYITSKAGVIGMTRAMARELGPDGVRVNAVMPGAIRTEHEVEMLPDDKEAAELLLPLQSLKRRGTADDTAGAFAFLASDDAAFITGQVICVDGGWFMY